MAVGIGNNLRKWELETIATDASSNVFKALSFDSLNTIREGIRNALCNSKPKTYVLNLGL